MVYPDQPARLERATSGLAYEPDGPCPSLADNNPTTRLEPLTSLEAIRILQDQHDDTVLAYLGFARSLHQKLNSLPGHGSLSNKQVLAVWALRDRSDLEIRSLFEEGRKLCETIRRYLKVPELTRTSK